MRLKPITFQAIYADGLVQLEGHSFEVDGRELVVHKERPQLLVIDPNYKVSSIIGFGIPIDPTKSRFNAAISAENEVSKIGAEEWAARCKLASDARKTLTVVEG
jgi:hypothetical protein